MTYRPYAQRFLVVCAGGLFEFIYISNQSIICIATTAWCGLP